MVLVLRRSSGCLKTARWTSEHQNMMEDGEEDGVFFRLETGTHWGEFRVNFQFLTCTGTQHFLALFGRAFGFQKPNSDVLSGAVLPAGRSPAGRAASKPGKRHQSKCFGGNFGAFVFDVFRQPCWIKNFCENVEVFLDTDMIQEEKHELKSFIPNREEETAWNS